MCCGPLVKLWNKEGDEGQPATSVHHNVCHHGLREQSEHFAVIRKMFLILNMDLDCGISDT